MNEQPFVTPESRMLSREEINAFRALMKGPKPDPESVVIRKIDALCDLALASLDKDARIERLEQRDRDAVYWEKQHDARVMALQATNSAIVSLQQDLKAAEQRAAEAESDAERLSKITWAIVHYFEEHPTMINLEGWDELSSAIHDTSNRVAAIDAALREGERE